jgi:hypothetical protein
MSREKWIIFIIFLIYFAPGRGAAVSYIYGFSGAAG